MRMIALAMAVALAGWQAEAVAGPALDALWVLPGENLPGQHVTLEVALEPVFDAAAPAVFPCLVRCRSVHARSTVTLRIFDAAGRVVKEGKIGADLQRGHNQFEFELDFAELPPGEYTARFVVNYAKDFPPAVATAGLTRVRSDDLAALLASLEPRVEELAARVAEAEREDRALPHPRMQLVIARRALAMAQADLAAARWADARDRIQYAQSVCHRAYAALVLADHAPERTAPIPPGDGPTVLEAGQAKRGGLPVYPFGWRLAGPDPAAPAEAAALGMDLLVLPCPPATTFPSKNQTASLASLHDTFFAEAERHGVAVVVELDPTDLPGWFLDAHPEVVGRGRVDLTQPTVRALLERHYAAALPYFAGKSAVLGVSLVDEPGFQFDGESVRQRFIEHVRLLYPDRLDLTRAWRAHLRDYEDITIWDDRYPWQEGRTFQFEWQSFHRGLATQYLEWARGAARAQTPRLPLGVGMPDTAFLAGESRQGVDREAMARLMDFQSVGAVVEAEDPVFGMRYPGPNAGYALARSMAPGKALYNLYSDFRPSQAMGLDRARDFVHAAVWESAMTGVGAHALAADSPVLARPEALEGFSAAALDLDRLADIINAFHRAPAEVGILFSAASKILDDGVPHLMTAHRAYEGLSFSGYNIRFVTETELAEGELDRLALLALPETPAVPNETFARIAAYVEQGRPIIRPGTPIPYNERGQSRADVLRPTGKTVLVRDPRNATEYLHAIDAVVSMGVLPNVPRPINAHGFPLEGVRTRFVVHHETPYLYAVNVRKDPVRVHLAGNLQAGRELIRGHAVSFPLELPPLQPMLIRMDTAPFEQEVSPATAPEDMKRKERRRYQRELREEERRVVRQRL